MLLAISPAFDTRHHPDLTMTKPPPISDFCPICCTYMADQPICPKCGAKRVQETAAKPAEHVEVLATYDLVDEAQPGGVAAGSLLLMPVIARTDQDGSRFGRLIVIDLTQPIEVWRFDLPGDLLNPPLLFSEDRFYFSTQTADPLALNASLHALAVDTGEELWRWDSGMRALSAPALMDDRLWMVGDGNQLWSVDIRSGEATPSLQLEGQRHIVAPAVAGLQLIVPSRGPIVQAVDASNRQVAWRYQHPSSAWAGAPLPVDDAVIVPFTDGSLAALDAHSGEVRWTQPPSGRHLSPLACDGERLFVGGRRGLQALDIRDGSLIWQMESARRVAATPLLYRTIVIVAGHDHIVRGLDAETGEEQWRWQSERGFEIAPIITPAGLALTNAGNTLSILAFPNPEPTIAEALAVQAWRVAASALAREGKLTEAALLLEEHDEPFAAAELWAVAGEAELAVRQYERAETESGWGLAAKLHQELGNWSAHAAALQRLAELVDDVDAWERARLAYLDIPMHKEAAACWREICRIKHYPFVRIEVKPDTGFVVDQYSLLTISIHNEGYGIAKMLSAKANGPFAGADMQSRVMGNLAPDRSTELQLSLMPTSAGKVFLELEVSFLLDEDSEPWTVKQRYPVEVAPHQAQRQSSSDLGQQLSAGFDVVARDDFRRSDAELESLYRQQLTAHQKNLARWNLRKAEYGILAPVELDNLIEREEREIQDLERKLDRLREGKS